VLNAEVRGIVIKIELESPRISWEKNVTKIGGGLTWIEQLEVLRRSLRCIQESLDKVSSYL
jgi:hypothetical protein